MSKPVHDLPIESHPVGVVMRSDAPLIERILAEKDQPNYAVALDKTANSRRWVSALAGLPSLVFLLGLLDAVKFTR